MSEASDGRPGERQRAGAAMGSERGRSPQSHVSAGKPELSNSLASWANAITAGRLVLSPLMFWVIPESDRGSWVAFGLWFVLCASDGIDGYVARRRGPSASGAFLDPLADKVLVLGAMLTLVGRDVFWWLPVVVIVARELVITVYRSVIGSRGVSMPASRSAKYKTLLQQLAVAFALLPLTARDATWFWNTLLWAAVILAVYSGAQYFWRAAHPEVPVPGDPDPFVRTDSL